MIYLIIALTIVFVIAFSILEYRIIAMKKIIDNHTEAFQLLRDLQNINNEKLYKIDSILDKFTNDIQNRIDIIKTNQEIIFRLNKKEKAIQEVISRLKKKEETINESDNSSVNNNTD